MVAHTFNSRTQTGAWVLLQVQGQGYIVNSGERWDRDRKTHIHRETHRENYLWKKASFSQPEVDVPHCNCFQLLTDLFVQKITKHHLCNQRSLFRQPAWFFFLGEHSFSSLTSLWVLLSCSECWWHIDIGTVSLKTTLCVCLCGGREGSVGDEVVTPGEKASGAFPMLEQYDASENQSRLRGMESLC